jgi:hypothetical protein
MGKTVKLLVINRCLVRPKRPEKPKEPMLWHLLLLALPNPQARFRLPAIRLWSRKLRRLPAQNYLLPAPAVLAAPVTGLPSCWLRAAV